MNESMKYVKKEKTLKKIIRTEVIFAPFLIIIPLIVGILFIYEWYYRGFLSGTSNFDIELILGLVMIIGNILFDIPFVRSLIKISRKK